MSRFSVVNTKLRLDSGNSQNHGSVSAISATHYHSRSDSTHCRDCSQSQPKVMSVISEITKSAIRGSTMRNLRNVRSESQKSEQTQKSQSKRKCQ
eukprot:208305-Amphidinium_carterae.1